MAEGMTEALATFVAELDYDRLPGAVVHAAKRAILDTVGVTLAGHGDETGRQILRYVRRLGSTGESSVLGTDWHVAAPEAALANGTLGHALDWDDTNIALNGHPSVVSLPPALALGEANGAAGRDLIVAYVAGFEVAARVGRAVGVGSYERGWHATGTCGPLAAAAAASRVLGADAARTRTAFGIAASHAAGLRQNFGTMMKPYHAGNAARAGVVAALLAEQGFNADTDVLEGRYGLLNVVGQDDRSAARGLKGLGERFHLLDTGVGVKVYPACANAHHAIDAVLDLLADEPIPPDQVERVVCGVPFRVPLVLVHHRPTTALEGKFSLEYCVAAALIDGQVGLAQFTDAQVRRPAIQALLPRVDTVVTEAGRDPMARNFAEVAIHLKDGRTRCRRVDHVRGSPRHPLDDVDLDAKFRQAAGGWPASTVARVSAQLWTLERLPGLRELTANLSAAPR